MTNQERAKAAAEEIRGGMPPETREMWASTDRLAAIIAAEYEEVFRVCGLALEYAKDFGMDSTPMGSALKKVLEDAE